MSEPTPAERARTVLRRASVIEVLSMPDRTDVVTVHGADASGRPLLLAAEGSGLAAAIGEDPEGLLAVVHAVDVCPVPMPDRIRGELWIAGIVTLVPPTELTAATVALAERDPAGALLDVGAGQLVLRMEIVEIRLADRLATRCATPEIVDPEAYRAATADPLTDGEPEWLGHLVCAHPAEFAQLCLRIDPKHRPPGCTLRPVALDRFGLRIRAQADGGHRDVLVPFAAPITAAHELPRAIASLFTAAR
jgi:hypothetical protein